MVVKPHVSYRPQRANCVQHKADVLTDRFRVQPDRVFTRKPIHDREETVLCVNSHTDDCDVVPWGSTVVAAIGVTVNAQVTEVGPRFSIAERAVLTGRQVYVCVVVVFLGPGDSPDVAVCGSPRARH